MTRPRLDVADVIRSCYDELLEKYGATLTPQQRRALDDLTACRTAALGGHVLGCPECGHQEISYNSCGNRHRPKCYGSAVPGGCPDDGARAPRGAPGGGPGGPVGGVWNGEGRADRLRRRRCEGWRGD